MEVQEKENMELVRGRNLYVLRDLISLRRGRAFAAKNRGKVEDHLMRQALKSAMIENKKMITTQLAVSGVTKYTAANSIISKEDQLSNGMDGSVEGRPPAKNSQLQPQYDTEVSDENISASDVTTTIKVETQETESNLA